MQRGLHQLVGQLVLLLHQLAGQLGPHLHQAPKIVRLQIYEYMLHVLEILAQLRSKIERGIIRGLRWIFEVILTAVAKVKSV